MTLTLWCGVAGLQSGVGVLTPVGYIWKNAAVHQCGDVSASDDFFKVLFVHFDAVWNVLCCSCEKNPFGIRFWKRPSKSGSNYWFYKKCSSWSKAAKCGLIWNHCSLDGGKKRGLISCLKSQRPSLHNKSRKLQLTVCLQKFPNCAEHELWICGELSLTSQTDKHSFSHPNLQSGVTSEDLKRRTPFLWSVLVSVITLTCLPFLHKSY